MKVRLTAPADRDISDILAETLRLFGANQTVRYAAIIDAGVNLITDQPNRATSKRARTLAQAFGRFTCSWRRSRKAAPAT